MNFINQMLFQDQFQTLFIVGSTSLLFILPEYLSNFGGVSRRHLKIAEEFSSKSCPFSRRFVVLVSCYPLELFHLSDILFLPNRSMSGVVFPFLFTEGHHSRRILHPHILAIVIQLSRCFGQVFFNQLMISLFFCI